MHDDRTKKALEKSIEHWRKNLLAETPDDALAGPEHCALCQEFWIRSDCEGCPVMERTEESDCEGSPYVEAFCSLRNWVAHFESDRAAVAKEEWRAAAKAEIDFLISLRN